MKFYFEGEFNSKPRENGRLAKVSINPYTQNHSRREVFVLVAKEINTVENGGDYALAMVGERKTPMIFPLAASKSKDKRILVMGSIPQPKHRHDGYLDHDRSNGKLLDESRGGGAWGAGSCFLAILEEGQRMVSNRLIVWENVGGELKKTYFDSTSEYELQYSKPDIEFI